MFHISEYTSWVLMAGYALLGLSVAIVAFMIFSEQENLNAQENLRELEGKKTTNGLVKLTRPFFSQYLVPSVRASDRFDEARVNYRRKLISAGLKDELNPDEFIAFKLLLRVDGVVDGRGLPKLVWRWSSVSQPALAATLPQADSSPSLTADARLTQAADVPQFFGLARDGTVRDIGLAKDWLKNPPKQVATTKAMISLAPTDCTPLKMSQEEAQASRAGTGQVMNFMVENDSHESNRHTHA
jgi:hypothetical protein